MNELSHFQSRAKLLCIVINTVILCIVQKCPRVERNSANKLETLICGSYCLFQSLNLAHPAFFYPFFYPILWISLWTSALSHAERASRWTRLPAEIKHWHMLSHRKLLGILPGVISRTKKNERLKKGIDKNEFWDTMGRKQKQSN